MADSPPASVRSGHSAHSSLTEGECRAERHAEAADRELQAAEFFRQLPAWASLTNPSVRQVRIA